METCIQIPTLWKYYHKQICGDYYRSDEKIIESIYVRAKLYKPGVLKKDYKSYISYRQKNIVSRQVNIQVLNTLFRVYLLPFYFILLQFKSIKKSLSDLRFFFLNSNKLQELTEFEKEIYRHEEQLLKLLNRTDKITYDDIKHLCDYIKAPLNREERNEQFENIISTIKHCHNENRSNFISLNAKSVRIEYTFKDYLVAFKDINEKNLLIKKEWNEENNYQKQYLKSIINSYNNEIRSGLINLNSKSVRIEYAFRDILTILKNTEKALSIKKDYSRDSKVIFFLFWFINWDMIDFEKASAEKSNINVISFLSGISQKQVSKKYGYFKQQFIDGIPNLRQWSDFKSHRKTIIDLLNNRNEIKRFEEWFEEMDVKVQQLENKKVKKNDLPR